MNQSNSFRQFAGLGTFAAAGWAEQDYEYRPFDVDWLLVVVLCQHRETNSWDGSVLVE
jgi:hypothetical protein